MFSIKGFRERRTPFAWVALFASIGPLALLIIAALVAIMR